MRQMAPLPSAALNPSAQSLNPIRISSPIAAASSGLSCYIVKVTLLFAGQSSMAYRPHEADIAAPRGRNAKDVHRAPSGNITAWQELRFRKQHDPVHRPIRFAVLAKCGDKSESEPPCPPLKRAERPSPCCRRSRRIGRFSVCPVHKNQ
jgi:hypothetical protein